MNNTMEYKGYLGSVEFSEADGVFFGKVMGIRGLISYQGTDAKELVEDFHRAVDDYLALCASEDKESKRTSDESYDGPAPQTQKKSWVGFKTCRSKEIEALYEKDPVTVLEPGEAARKEYGELWGSQVLALTKEQLDALNAGRQLAIQIRDEYVLFLSGPEQK